MDKLPPFFAFTFITLLHSLPLLYINKECRRQAAVSTIANSIEVTPFNGDVKFGGARYQETDIAIGKGEIGCRDAFQSDPTIGSLSLINIYLQIQVGVVLAQLCGIHQGKGDEKVALVGPGINVVKVTGGGYVIGGADRG